MQEREQGAQTSLEKKTAILYRYKTADDSLECESRARPTHSSFSPQMRR